MPVFFGYMQMRDHPARMPAVVHVDKGTVRLQSGKDQLGEWKLYEVVIEEQDESTISFRVDDDEVLLELQEHDGFLAETAQFRRDDRRRRRMPTHEAFRPDTDDGPTLAEEMREDVGREVGSVADEVRQLWDMVNVGWPLWVGLAVFLVLGIVITPIIVGLLFVVGVVSLIVGAIAYVETSVALKLPDTLTAARLLAVGVVTIGIGIVFAILFN